MIFALFRVANFPPLLVNHLFVLKSWQLFSGTQKICKDGDNSSLGFYAKNTILDRKVHLPFLVFYTSNRWISIPKLSGPIS